MDNLLRCIIRVGVAYGSDVELVRRLLMEASQSHSDVLTDPAPVVFFADFGDSALNFDVYFWVNTGGERGARLIRSDVRFTIDRLFRENGVVIAYPQQDVHLNGSIEIQSKPDT